MKGLVQSTEKGPEGNGEKMKKQGKWQKRKGRGAEVIEKGRESINAMGDRV